VDTVSCKEYEHNNRRIMFSMWSIPRSSASEAVKRWRYNSVYSTVVGYSSVSNDLSTVAEEFPLLGDVTKQRLMKTLQAGEDLACSDL
jgi:hypothetical protein